jgi:murein DD-endopeptidase MepM/ murein hydrolase activator NlpD
VTRNVIVLLALLALAGCGTSSTRTPAPVISAPAAPPTSSAAQGYVVQPGDTIYSIAREQHLSVRALIDANQLHPPYQLQAGQRLLFPGTGFYIVGKGESLSGIAHKTGIAFSTLARINGLTAPYSLQVGQKLQLPANATPTAPAVASLSPAPAPAMPTPSPAKPAISNDKPQPPEMPSAAPKIQPPQIPAQNAPAPPALAAVTPLPAPMARSGRGFVWPVKGDVIAEFGTTGKGLHNDGINIAAPKGTAVHAAESGVVAYAGNELRGFGNLLLVKHEDGWMTAYAHNDQLLVKRGDLVKRGQKIATIGETGGVGQPQLHFEVRQGTRAIDPMTVLGAKSLPASLPLDLPEPG